MGQYAPVYMTVYDGITLGVIGSSDVSFPSTDPAGTVIGAITGKTEGSALEITVGGANVAIVGTNFVVGATPPAAGPLAVTVRETKADADNSPVDTVINFTVT